MSYFTEIKKSDTYAGKKDDFHFTYNANAGGGQSFLAGKFRDRDGNLIPPISLNGRMAQFRFSFINNDGTNQSVILNDNSTCYEIKPRAEGERSMKLGVEGKNKPSDVIPVFLMLPETCGIKRTKDIDTSILNGNNYWVQSMWLDVDTATEGKAIFTPRDCIICGGVNIHGQGTLRYFSVDFNQRISDIIQLAGENELDEEVLSCVNHFANIYNGNKPFVYGEALAAIKAVMKHLSSKYPEQYSGTLDPLAFTREHLSSHSTTVPQSSTNNPNTSSTETEKHLLLDTALKVFTEKRKERDSEKGGWLQSGIEVNALIRSYFDSLNEEKLKTFDADRIKELFCGLPNANAKTGTLHPMWAGSPGSGWDPIQKEDVKTIVNALVLYKKDIGVAARFLQQGFEKPKGFGPSVISELLMKFHPESCFKNGRVTHEALAWLGLIDFQYKNEFTADEYKQVCGAAAMILARLKEMKLPRQISPDGSEDSEPPDYLTVNEFLWFVHSNQDLIKETVMSKQLKPVNSKATKKTGTQKLSEAFKDNEMLKRLAAALRTKPFAILAGHSGTGKSQLVRRLAYMTCNNSQLEQPDRNAPGNYCMIQVKPNWHDSTDLLGYYSEMNGRHFVTTPFVEFLCKAYAYPDTPFFVCLDEMNLAPVEQYFAEYLSAIESMEKKGNEWITDSLVELDKEAAGNEKVDSDILLQVMKGAASAEAADWIGKHGLTIPKNLFVVGTVNMDETTCQFSRKVLDRAMTLLMNEVKFDNMAASRKPSEEKPLDDKGICFFLEGDVQGDIGPVESKLLAELNQPLANTPFVVAYRFANEYALYEAALAELDGVNLAAATEDDKKKRAATALDHVVLMKLLPRIHGMKQNVRDIFDGRKFKTETGEKQISGLKSCLPDDGLSVDMMKRILERGDDYLTFWP